MSPVETLARQLAERRLARDRRIAAEANCPPLLKLDAYLTQARLDALIATAFAKPKS